MIRRGGRRIQNANIRRRDKSGYTLKKQGAVSKKNIAPAGKIKRGFSSANLWTFFKIVFAIAIILAAVAGLGKMSIWLYGKAVTSDFFTTRHIDIAGNTRLSRDMVLQYGGIREGSNSLAVSITDVERKLRETPWVEEVTVKRLLPDRFVINLKERMPSFWVHQDGQLYYANEKGEKIAPVESKNFLSLPTLNIMPGAEDQTRYLGKFLKDINNGLLPVEAGAIASVTLTPSNGIEVFIEDRDLRLAIATDDWEGNLTRMGMALTDLAKRRELGSVREARAVDGNVWIIRNQNAPVN